MGEQDDAPLQEARYRALAALGARVDVLVKEGIVQVIGQHLPSLVGAVLAVVFEGTLDPATQGSLTAAHVDKITTELAVFVSDARLGEARALLDHRLAHEALRCDQAGTLPGPPLPFDL